MPRCLTSLTRLHSSRMRTAHSLTVSPSMLYIGGCTWSRGVYLVLGVYLVPGGCVYLVPGGVPGPRGRGLYLVQGGCTWSWGCTWSLGVAGPRGVYLVPGGRCTWSQRDVPGPGGCTWSQGGLYLVWGCKVLPPVNRMTDACKNITSPQLRCGR